MLYHRVKVTFNKEHRFTSGNGGDPRDVLLKQLQEDRPSQAAPIRNVDVQPKSLSVTVQAPADLEDLNQLADLLVTAGSGGFFGPNPADIWVFAEETPDPDRDVGANPEYRHRQG